MKRMRDPQGAALHAPRRWREPAMWLAAYGSVFLLLLWARELWPVLLGAAGATATLAGLLAGPRLLGPDHRGYRALGGALLAVVAGVGAGVIASERFGRIEFDWERLLADREARLGAQIERRMANVVQRGERAAGLAAAAAGADRWTLFRELAEIRERTGVDAVAVLSDVGDLVAWAGEHRGMLRDRGQLGPVSFGEGPLFSYLYFSAPASGGARRAVAAVLMESGLGGDAPWERGFSARFAAVTRARVGFGPGSAPDAAWRLVVGGDTIVHARFAPITQTEWRATVATTTRRVATITALLALVLLAAARIRTRRLASRRAASLPLLAIAAGLAVAPLGVVLGLQRVFSPLLFLLPVPGDLTLGSVLAVLLPLATLVATLQTPAVGRRAFGATLAVGALAVAIGYPGALRLLRDAAAPPLLEGGAALWLGYALAGTVPLAMLTVFALPRLRGLAAFRGWAWPPAGPLAPAAWVGIGALALAAALGVLRSWEGARGWMAGDAYMALWAVPFLLLALALAPYGGSGGRLARWLGAGWLAATAVLPNVWVAHIEARLAAAEREIATLGARPDVYLDYLLFEFAREARGRYAGGESGVLLLYRTWVASGLAREPYSARIMLWSLDGEIEHELGLGGAAEAGASMDALQRAVASATMREEPRVLQTLELPDVNRILTVPLPDGRVVTVTVPPRRTLEAPTAVAPFLGGLTPPDARLSLVPVRAPVPPSDEVYWTRSATGWRSETVVRYTEGFYHAHLEVRTMPLGLRLARATLLIAVNLCVLALLWAAGNVARGISTAPAGGWRALLGTFRARITLALFGFFLLPTALFGWVAYGALAGEVARAARMVAERAVALAVVEFREAPGNLRDLAAHAGSDVLIYHQGELAGVSSPEALELGIFEAWMPPGVFRALQTGEETGAVQMHRLGRQEFLTAYHTLLPAGTLAVPMALAAGDAALRQREMAHLILFALLIGALLSFGLSVVVGRAFAGPFGKLRRAASAVGAGNLNVRLPERETDEFGQLFASFNRMVRRLRRARARELRTERVLAWGEMARQIAHEIKNPLTPIKLSVQHLRRARADRRPDFDEILDTSVTQILREIDRLAEIARAFSRYGAPTQLVGPLDAVDVHAVVREALTLYRAGEPRIRFIERVEPDVPRVRARADELKEVLINLLENARIALGDEGSIIVAACRVDGVVELEVIDDGPGIPADLLARVFEPHFSTRSTGTGLGLPIVRRLVESWGGTVGAESAPNGGATLRVRIPVAA